MERSRHIVIDSPPITASAAFRDDEELSINRKGSSVEIRGEDSGATLRLGYGLVEALDDR